MFTNLRDFLSTGLPGLMAGSTKLHALFATYKTVRDYQSGPVQTGKEGLTIQVQNGNLEYPPMTDLIYFTGTPLQPLADIGSAAMDREAQQAQFELEGALKLEVQEGAAFLAVVYAGLSAFEQAVEMARRIKADNPAAKIVITTCDCEIEDKRWHLAPMLDRKEIEAVVVTHMCGGRDMMAEILRGTIDTFQVAVAV